MKFTPRKSAAAALAAAVAALFAGSAHAVPSVSIGDASVIEGIPGQRNFVRVPVTLSEAAAETVSVTVDLRRGEGARFGADIRRRTETVEIPVGATRGLVRFLIGSDDEFEPTETVRVLISSATGGGVVVDDGRAVITLFDDDIPPGALVGSLGTGVSVSKIEATATDTFSLASFLGAPGYDNSTTLGADDLTRAIDENGRPTTGNSALLSGKLFDPPALWPPASATDSTPRKLPRYIRRANYVGAFDPRVPRAEQWDQGWTVSVNGNADVWRFFGGLAGTALAAAGAPAAGGSCPAGTTAAGTVSSRFGALANDETGLFDGVSGDYDVCLLPRRISADLTLTNDNVYEIQTGFPGTYVGNGEALRTAVATPVNVTLSVEPGTIVFGGDDEALVVTRGSKIDAVGLKTAPIVFTSDVQLSGRFDGNPATPADTGTGEWAGLALTGNARDTTCTGADYAACDRPLEGNVGNYGGPDDADSSGQLQYVVIRHAGNDVDGQGNELNGLTLGGVGRKTSISFVQVHRGFDDGFEMFGGSVFMSNLVISGASDDSFDFDNGWTGGAQFVYIVQEDSVTPGLGRAIEGGSTLSTASPIATFPLLANFTAVGPASRIAGGSIDDGQGVLLRGGVRAQLWNSIFTGDQPKGCLDFDDEDGETFGRALEEGGTATAPGPHLFIRNSIFDCSAFSTVENG